LVVGLDGDAGIDRKPAPGPGARSNATVGIGLNPITESSLKRNASEARSFSA